VAQAKRHVRAALHRARRGGGGTFDARLEHYKQLTSPFLRYATEAVDATGAALGVEPRHPFLDRRLVEFCLALPAGHKLWRGWGRAILRRAMEGTLVDEVRWRVGKTRLGPQFDRAFRGDLALVADVIERDPGPLADFADMVEVRRAFRSYVAAGGKRDGVVVWSAATLGLWLRQAGVGDSVREVARCGAFEPGPWAKLPLDGARGTNERPDPPSTRERRH
jgi:asparagine synthetase B (glutamine-hydrolysing)